MKTKFEKGKWYKGEESGNFYIKFSHVEYISENELFLRKIYYSEKIVNGKFTKVFDYWANNSFENYALNNPVDIQEIQQYLPEGHPDKIKENIKNIETFKITRTQFKEIYDIAYDKWKIQIANLIQTKLGVFDDQCKLSYKEVTKIFNMATTKIHLSTLTSIFPTFHNENVLDILKCKDTTDVINKNIILIRHSGEYKYNSFYLSTSYNWELKTDSVGIQCLIPTSK